MPLDKAILGDLYEDFESTDDLDQLAELIRRYSERASEQLNAIVAAIQSGDTEPVRRAAHRLKGASRTIGANLVGTVAAKIEAASADEDMVAARAALPELEAAIAVSAHALADAADAIARGVAPAGVTNPALFAKTA